MYLEIFVRYAHFISIFVIVGTLVGEFVLLKKEMLPSEIAKVGLLDRYYGISAMTLLAAGFTLWFAIGKPAYTYTYNWIFWLKIALFTAVGILSIYPTIFFAKNGKKSLPEKVIVVPKLVRQMVIIEIILLVFIPLCASLMAKGVGYFG